MASKLGLIVIYLFYHSQILMNIVSWQSSLTLFNSNFSSPTTLARLWRPCYARSVTDQVAVKRAIFISYHSPLDQWASGSTSDCCVVMFISFRIELYLASPWFDQTNQSNLDGHTAFFSTLFVSFFHRMWWNHPGWIIVLLLGIFYPTSLCACSVLSHKR